MTIAQISKFTPLQTKRDPRGQAIIIGGSMAGLLGARVLADHFERVTILERDVYPEGAEGRRGLPQGHHLHALLGRGQKIVEEFFPGIRQEMIDSGACDLDSGEDLVWRTPHGWGKPFRSGVMALSFSRPFLDWHIRRRLAAIDNIKIINGAVVTELEASSDLKGVGGVFFEVIGSPHDIRGIAGVQFREPELTRQLVVELVSSRSSEPNANGAQAL